MKQRLLILLLCLYLSPLAQAGVPAFVTYSGRLTDGTGWGESSEATLVFNLYDAADTVEPFWTTTHPGVAVIDGYFTVNLGMCNEDGSTCTVNPAEAVFPADLPDQMWVGVDVDGVELSERRPVGSVPYAARSGRADRADRAEYIEPGGVRNLRWMRENGVIRVTSESGAPLSETNYGLVSVPSFEEPGRWLTLMLYEDHTFQDVQGPDGSNLTGWLFRVTKTRAWDAWMPVFIYAVNRDDTSAGLRFAVSRDPTAEMTLDEVDRMGNLTSPPVLTSQWNLFLIMTEQPELYVARPMVIIGATRMRKPTEAVDWLFETPDGQSGIGLRALHSVAADLYEFPLGQNGAQPGQYSFPGGPAWEHSSFVYHLSRDGVCMVALNSSGLCTNGTGTEAVRFALPYINGPTHDAARPVIVSYPYGNETGAFSYHSLSWVKRSYGQTSFQIGKGHNYGDHIENDEFDEDSSVDVEFWFLPFSGMVF